MSHILLCYLFCIVTQSCIAQLNGHKKSKSPLNDCEPDIVVGKIPEWFLVPQFYHDWECYAGNESAIDSWPHGFCCVDCKHVDKYPIQYSSICVIFSWTASVAADGFLFKILPNAIPLPDGDAIDNDGGTMGKLSCTDHSGHYHFRYLDALGVLPGHEEELLVVQTSSMQRTGTQVLRVLLQQPIAFA